MRAGANNMNRYMAIKLQGVMQAWGGHTYEDLRHSELIPTRSAVLGLLAACLGVDRHDTSALENLSASVNMAVRMDSEPARIMDYHTILDARKVGGKSNRFPVESKREYLCDAVYTVLLQEREGVPYSLDTLKHAIRHPIYTPFLGRRACPISRPLFEGIVTAVDFEQAFALIEPTGGVIYSEKRLHDQDAVWRLRDEPVYSRKRQFASRNVFIHSTGKEG